MFEAFINTVETFFFSSQISHMSPQHLPLHKRYSGSQLNVTYSRWALHKYAGAGELMNCATNTFPLWASLSFLIYTMRTEEQKIQSTISVSLDFRVQKFGWLYGLQTFNVAIWKHEPVKTIPTTWSINISCKLDRCDIHQAGRAKISE